MDTEAISHSQTTPSDGKVAQERRWVFRKITSIRMAIIAINDDIVSWFKRITGKHKAQDMKAAPAASSQQPERFKEYPITTIVYEHSEEGFQVDTHSRDKVLAAAREALLRMDHTKYPLH